MPDRDLLWTPSRETANGSNIAHFIRWLRDERDRNFDDYADLWRWSSSDLNGFWAAIWDYYGLDELSGYDAVLADSSMPGATWFPGARTNFAERCLSRASTHQPALIAVAEGRSPRETSWQQLRQDVAAVAATLRELGVRPGDRIAGYLPNIPEAVVALLASAAIGAIWTACSPDFGTPSVLARLQQVEPTVLIAADGYRYGGKEFDQRPAVDDLVQGLPSVEHLLAVDYLYPSGGPGWTQRTDIAQLAWSTAVATVSEPEFADVAFDHPLWILWSSGTTGVPKGIVHSHGGIVIELLKALGLGVDLRADDRYFFVTSTSWMVWNFLVSGLLHGSTIVLYDGSPTYPDVNGAWNVAAQTQATIVGVGAGYLMAGEKAGARTAEQVDLSVVRSIVQTGSTLPPSTWHWAYDHLAPNAWLQSVCGGTDICSALAGGTPLLPVQAGTIQCPALGVALSAWSADGQPLIGEQGELVVTEPMPSMPLYFLNDPDGDRYRSSYFATYPGVWRHGDWVTIHDDLSVVVSGRSDTTLNRMGIRMGSADIYAVVEQLPEVADSLIVGAELTNGHYHMPLFIVPAIDTEFDDNLRHRINDAIRHELSPRHLPDTIVAVPVIPRTLTGKKLELPVKRILQGAHSAEVSAEGAITNPQMLAWFAQYAQRTLTADNASTNIA